MSVNHFSFLKPIVCYQVGCFICNIFCITNCRRDITIYQTRWAQFKTKSSGMNKKVRISRLAFSIWNDAKLAWGFLVTSTLFDRLCEDTQNARFLIDERQEFHFTADNGDNNEYCISFVFQWMKCITDWISMEFTR